MNQQEQLKEDDEISLIDILLFLKATSALDTDTESVVMEAVRAMHGKKTILIITHRLSTVEHCDRLIRLTSGRILESKSSGASVNGKVEAA